MSKQEIPKYPAHAVKMIDNSAGDEDVLFLFAYKVDGVFYWKGGGAEIFIPEENVTHWKPSYLQVKDS